LRVSVACADVIVDAASTTAVLIYDAFFRLMMIGRTVTPPIGLGLHGSEGGHDSYSSVLTSAGDRWDLCILAQEPERRNWKTPVP
jgi:hypothetical protein